MSILVRDLGLYSYPMQIFILFGNGIFVLHIVFAILGLVMSHEKYFFTLFFGFLMRPNGV